jgi:hypothetical protein
MSGKQENTEQDLQADIELEIAKQTSRTSIRLWKMSVGTLWKGQKRRDCTQSKSHRGRSIDHSRNFFPHQLKEG